MIKKICFILLFAISLTTLAQDEETLKKWNKNYQLVNIREILDSKKVHVDSINKGMITGNYYTGAYKYRFKAIRKGDHREISSDIKQTIAKVLKIHGADQQYINLLKYEVLMECNGQQIWMPIQSQLLKSFKEEIKKGAQAMLYCSLLTDYSKKGLNNIFIISEFIKP